MTWFSIVADLLSIAAIATLLFRIRFLTKENQNLKMENERLWNVTQWVRFRIPTCYLNEFDHRRDGVEDHG